MFFNLVWKNSRKSRKENGLFFASLIVSIIAFYIILSLENQDVMQFLLKMESDAVNRIYQLLPALYGVSLILLFSLVYFAGTYQMQLRSQKTKKKERKKKKCDLRLGGQKKNNT